MKVLRHRPVFLILLPLFFCLHGLYENYGFVTTGEIANIGIVILFAVALLFVLLFFIFRRNLPVASLTTLFIGTWYLFFGAIVDWLQLHFLWLSSYSKLLPLLFIATVLFYLFVKRKEKFRRSVFVFINILLGVYCLFDAYLLIVKISAPKKDEVKPYVFDPSPVVEKPNVYFMLFDEYPGFRSLNDHFHFKNDSIQNFLVRRGFHFLPYRANYNFTLFSMASQLNLRYAPQDYNPLAVSEKDILHRYKEVSEGFVFADFRSMGYRINNFSIFDIGTMPGVSRKNRFLPVHSTIITDKILHNRIMRTSGFLFKTGPFALPDYRKKYYYRLDENNLKMEQLLLNAAKDKDTQPRFTYAHFVMPHYPYYRDSTGKYVDESIVLKGDNAADKTFFISYLKYANRVIEKMISKIVADDPSAIFIIMSDHGFREYSPSDKNTDLFDNIAAVKFPSGIYPDEKVSRSNVNFFRYLFNVVYHQHIPYLADSSIFLKDKVPGGDQ